MENRAARKKAWSWIVLQISHAALGEKIPKWRLEVIFQVGDGSGKVWRSWEDGDRIARDYTRTRIINEALQKGWLPDHFPPFTKALPDEIIHALAVEAAEPLESLPSPPNLHTYRTARIIVNALLDDAVDGIPSYERRAEFSCLGKGHTLSLKSWEAAVEKLQKLLALKQGEGSKNRGVKKSGHAVEDLRAELITAYRRRGYK
jgi:hypothetical protein